MPNTGQHPISATPEDDFLRRRVALYLQVLFLINVGFLVITLAQPAETLARQRVLEWGLVTMLGAGWLYFNRYRPARWVVVASDVVVPLVLTRLYFRLILLEGRVEGGLVILILVSLVLVLRAALIPSSVRRTLVVGAVAEVAAVVGSLLMTPDRPWIDHVFVGGLGAAFVTITVVTSSVIYGLRHEVQAARRLGQYELIRKLGEGGMGVVYEATHVLLKRPTAVKLLPTAGGGEEAVSRFEREVIHTSRLEHPNNVAIYDYGRTPEGEFYYAMEYLNGYTLEQLVRDYGPLDDARTVHILRQTADALAEAHALGLVHRDIKPANIMLCHRGGVPDMVKVLDFGLVKPTQAAGQSDDLQTMAVTRDTTIVGTPGFMSPEAIRGGVTIGPGVDVYAMGAVGFFLLTGRTVFEGETAMDVCSKHLTLDPDRASDVAGRVVDDALEQFLGRCLAKEPDDRYRDGSELGQALDELSIHGWSARWAHTWWTDHRHLLQPTGMPVGERTQLAVNVEGWS